MSPPAGRPADGGGMMMQRGRVDMAMHDNGGPQSMMNGGPRMGTLALILIV
jgi:hypothetical protein